MDQAYWQSAIAARASFAVKVSTQSWQMPGMPRSIEKLQMSGAPCCSYHASSCRPFLSGTVPCHVSNPSNGPTDILPPGRQDSMKLLLCKE